MTPGELVRERRMELGWSQARLATAAATTQAVVSRIERGEASPTVDMLLRLAQAMGTELSLTLVPH
ncbi:helix-turn-helix domain-containing protein [Streptacidiphilus neutrinimicus]|uniref:helix-turn-helix domain-containing protein n=1 Tax=Streptacidiphilus neutrinimicus TaxID=105420 RepID=UPI000693AE51|nr:helix-turn-helix transcriptional regulator [Streptacidiphilus neutrinimicus]